MHDNDAQLLEREKRRNLSGGQHRTSTPIDNAPGWNEHLASTSEAHVKADRSTASIHDMQRNTVDYIHARHSPDERLGPREASYVRDEVNGPLGSARVGEFEGVVGDGDLGLEDLDIESDGRTVTRRVVHEETTVTRESEPTESEANVSQYRVWSKL
ncbi:hypothetical protein HYDPIDRAFT_26307 [Hydnomerulius pinastri MD-312]|nr:hypothetical protein HYDPIDRAFT_26307 [Hydnomerulius pinastri MD-312]